MARNDVVNADGSINYNTIGGFKDRLDGHDTSLAHIVTDVKSAYGAKGDGVTDDTTAIQNAINALGSNGGVVYLPNGTYIISNTLSLPNNTILMGQSKFNTKITDNGHMLNIPLIAPSNWSNATGNSSISIQKLQVITFGERTVFTISMRNTIDFSLIDCYIQENSSSTSSTSSKHGVENTISNGYTGSLFLTKIQNCRFSKAMCFVQSTDSYLQTNEFWGNTRDYALNLYQASNSLVHNNQIVGGQTYGGIYIVGNTTGLKITNNYFDGSYYNVNTMWGIYTTGGTVDRCLINSNNFWELKAGGIYSDGMVKTTVEGNVFDNCDYYENLNPDIKLTSTNASSYGNIIVGNIFFKDTKINASTGATSARTTTSPPPCLSLYQITGGYPATIVSNNSCSWNQYYGNNVYGGDASSVYIKANNSGSQF